MSKKDPVTERGQAEQKIRLSAGKLEEKINMRTLCEMTDISWDAQILWVDSIVVEDICYPKKKVKKTKILSWVKNVFNKIINHIKKRRNLLWQLQNNLQD